MVGRDWSRLIAPLVCAARRCLRCGSVYWPEFLTAPFRKAGGVFGVGMAALAVVLGVVALGLVGVLILLGAGLVLLCAELWRDAARSAQRRDAFAGTAAEVENQLELAGAEITALRQAADASEVLGERVEELELENASLRAQLASPALTPQQLIVSISNQLTLVDMTMRHRELEIEDGADRAWPVVHVGLLDDGFAIVRAYVGDDAPQLAEEWVALVLEQDPGFAVFGQVMFAGDREITARFDSALLPPLLVQRLDEEGDQNPSGLALALAGFHLEPYRALDDPQLVALRGRLVAVADSMADAIVSPNEPGEPQELMP